MTMDADKTTSGDDEITAVAAKTIETYVRGLAEVVVEQTTDFCKWLFTDRLHRLRVARFFVIGNHEVHRERKEWTGGLMDTCFHRRRGHILPYEVQTPVEQVLENR